MTRAAVLDQEEAGWRQRVLGVTLLRDVGHLLSSLVGFEAGSERGGRGPSSAGWDQIRRGMETIDAEYDSNMHSSSSSNNKNKSHNDNNDNNNKNDVDQDDEDGAMESGEQTPAACLATVFRVLRRSLRDVSSLPIYRPTHMHTYMHMHAYMHTCMYTCLPTLPTDRPTDLPKRGFQPVPQRGFQPCPKKRV